MNTEFPILPEGPAHCFPSQLRSIPWELIRPHQKQALANHYQTLERLAERHGLSAQEAVAILEDKPYCSRWKRTDGSREEMDAQISEGISCLKGLVEKHNWDTKEASTGSASALSAIPNEGLPVSNSPAVSEGDSRHPAPP